MIPYTIIAAPGRFSIRSTIESYIFWVFPYILLNPLKRKNFGSSVFFSKKRAHSEGVSVSELNPLNTVAAAIVKANCL